MSDFNSGYNPSSYPAAAPNPPPKSSMRFRDVLLVFVILFLLGSLFLNLVLGVSVIGMAGGEGGKSLKEKPEFEEQYFDGKADAADKIAVIALDGIISSGEPGHLGSSMVDDLKIQLQQARDNDKVKAVVLRINSPGGEVNASDVIYHEVQKTNEKKPVITYMESVAASGGYYAAMGSRYVMASDLTITGSIGVILQSYNYKDLIDKVGLKAVTFKSGKMKDMLNGARELSPEEATYVQSLIDETYQKFVGIVAKSRKLDAAQLKAGVADGRIVSGEIALKEKLVDQLGYLEDAYAKARELGGIKGDDYEMIEYKAPFSFGKLFSLMGESAAAEKKVKVQIGPDAVKVEAGKLYFLSPLLLNGL